MAASVRLIRRYAWLIDTIHRAGHITLEEINKKWMNERTLRLEHEGEIPDRTFHRHRQAIADIFGIDILCNRYNGNTYYIDNDEVLDEPSFTSWLLNGLLIDNLLIDNEEIAKRIIFEETPGGTGFISPIIEAMTKRKVLRMTYRSFNSSKAIEWEIIPCGLKQSKQRWYLIAKNQDFDSPSVFALDRIQEMELTDASFTPDNDLMVKDYFDEVIGVNVDNDYDSEKVMLRVYGRQQAYMDSLPLHKSQRLLVQTKEYSDYELNLRPEYEFQHEILRLGPDAEILSPQWLRDEIKWLAEEITRRYSKKRHPEYLFLDFDGVLNSGNYQTDRKLAKMPASDQFGPLFDPKAVEALKEVIDSYPDLKIVITSLWRYIHSFDKLRKMWKMRGMPGRLHAVLPTDSMSDNRSEEIADYLHSHNKTADYIIIDDEDSFTAEQRTRCIITNPDTGLRSRDIKAFTDQS